MSLRDEVAKCVPLDRRGWGLCPFHHEDSASFHVFLATKGKHKGEEIYFCQGCGAKGDLRDWRRIMEGKTSEIPKEDPEVRRIRLADERVKAERDRLWLAFIRRYPDTPTEIFDVLETVQIRLNEVRLRS